MSTSLRTASLLLILLAAAFMLAAQFWLTPLIERESAAYITESLAAQGLSVKAPIHTSFNFLSRTLTIDPFDIEPAMTLGIKSAHFSASNVRMTWQGLLATTDFGERFLPEKGILSLAESANLDELTISALTCDVTFHLLSATNIRLDAEVLVRLKNGEKFTRLPLLLGAMRIADTDIKVEQAGQNLHFGSLVLEDLTESMIASLTIHDILFKEKEKEQFRLGSIRQETIRLYSDEKWAALLPDLIDPSRGKQQDKLIELFLGDEPLIGKIVLTDILTTVDEKPAQIREIIWTAEENSARQALAIHGLAFAASVIEAEAGQRLPIPPVMHANLELAIKKNAEKDYRLQAGIGVDELFAFEGAFSCGIDDFTNLIPQLTIAPVKDLSLSYTDKTLLARVTQHYAPNNGKAFLLNLITEQETPEEKPLTEKLTQFIEQPGTLTVSSPAGRSFRFAELAAMNGAAAMQFFTVSVTPGKESLDDQLTRIQAEH